MQVQLLPDAHVLVGLSGCGRRVFTPEIAGSNPAQDTQQELQIADCRLLCSFGPSGETADAMVSKAVAFGREGANPSLAT